MAEMNLTQRAAEAWLLAQGHKVTFQRRRSPSFVTPSGEGFEPKLVRHNAVVFSASQLAALRASFPTATLLLFAAGASEPEAVVAVEELAIPGYWRQYRLVLTDLSRRAA